MYCWRKSNFLGEIKMIRCGSQVRETVEEAEVIVISCKNEELIVEDCGKKELYVLNDDYSGYVLVYNGLGYEFVRSI